MSTEQVQSVIESLQSIADNDIMIDIESLSLCLNMLRMYADRLECRKDIKPNIPAELTAVIAILDKVNIDMVSIHDCIVDDIKALTQS